MTWTETAALAFQELRDRARHEGTSLGEQTTPSLLRAFLTRKTTRMPSNSSA